MLSILLLVGVIIFPLFAEQVVRFEGIITNVMQNVSALSANPDSLKDYAIFRYLERASIDVNVVWITDFLKNSVSTIVEHIGGLVTTGSTSLFSWIFGFF